MKHRCVCCGNITINDPEPLMHEICPVCFWENDPIQNENPDYKGCSNRISLNE
ncbi:MAG: hydrolase, partial [Clostridia bacterium]|nr:hydrolase [Clostridia bacterium]